MYALHIVYTSIVECERCTDDRVERETIENLICFSFTYCTVRVRYYLGAYALGST